MRWLQKNRFSAGLQLVLVDSLPSGAASSPPEPLWRKRDRLVGGEREKGERIDVPRTTLQTSSNDAVHNDNFESHQTRNHSQQVASIFQWRTMNIWSPTFASTRNQNANCERNVIQQTIILSSEECEDVLHFITVLFIICANGAWNTYHPRYDGCYLTYTS